MAASGAEDGPRVQHAARSRKQRETLYDGLRKQRFLAGRGRRLHLYRRAAPAGSHPAGRGRGTPLCLPQSAQPQPAFPQYALRALESAALLQQGRSGLRRAPAGRQYGGRILARRGGRTHLLRGQPEPHARPAQGLLPPHGVFLHRRRRRAEAPARPAPRGAERGRRVGRRPAGGHGHQLPRVGPHPRRGCQGTVPHPAFLYGI